jgi:hypothetical protein
MCEERAECRPHGYTGGYTVSRPWQATGGTLAGPDSGPLPGGIFSTQLLVQVAEVQAINNR